MKKYYSIIGMISLMLVVRIASAESINMHSMGGREVAFRITNDALNIQTFRDGLRSVVNYLKTRPDIVRADTTGKSRSLNRETREELWNAWQQWLDYSMALESIRHFHRLYMLIPDRRLREQSFCIARAAFVAQYRSSLELVALLENNPETGLLLDDAVPESGLPEGSYRRFKTALLNPARATEFAAFQTISAIIPGEVRSVAGDHIQEDVAAIMKLSRKEGPLLTIENAGGVIQSAASAAWLPVQAGVATWMGDTKIWRKEVSLISPEQIATNMPRFEPGDIMLQRREWYMSNIGLPGFWSHAVIYIGTPDERRRYFGDPEVKSWVKSQGQDDGIFNNLLSARYPGVYALCASPDNSGHMPRVIEAVSEGVVFTTLEHSAAADSICILRPRLSKKERAVAILRSFRYHGRPYDFNFDFITDSSLVCTELVFKSYESCPDSRGIKFQLVKILGRQTMPANELVRQFDATCDTPNQQFDLALFLDGREKGRIAEESTVEEFRKSWKRPKWHIVMR